MNIRINNINDFIFIISLISSYPFLKEIETAKKNRISLKQFIKVVFSKPVLIISFVGFVNSFIFASILIYKLLS